MDPATIVLVDMCGNYIQEVPIKVGPPKSILRRIGGWLTGQRETVNCCDITFGPFDREVEISHAIVKIHPDLEVPISLQSDYMRELGPGDYLTFPLEIA